VTPLRRRFQGGSPPVWSPRATAMSVEVAASVRGCGKACGVVEVDRRLKGSPMGLSGRRRPGRPPGTRGCGDASHPDAGTDRGPPGDRHRRADARSIP
jgi:hypothetical protein